MTKIYSGTQPFSHLDDSSVPFHVVEGKQNERGTSKRPIPDSLWDAMVSCWRLQPTDRPRAVILLEQLRDAFPLPITPAVAVHGHLSVPTAEHNEHHSQLAAGSYSPLSHRNRSLKGVEAVLTPSPLFSPVASPSLPSLQRSPTEIGVHPESPPASEAGQPRGKLGWLTAMFKTFASLGHRSKLRAKKAKSEARPANKHK